MASSVSICSNALIALGANPISSLDTSGTDGLDRVRIAANLYPTVKAAILRSHPWNCATKRVQLAPLTEAPAFGYAYQFTLPGDSLRVLSIGDEGQVGDYAIENNRLLCDENSVDLRYVADIEESEFDSQLVDVMEAAMAARMAYPITSSASMVQATETRLELLMRKARASNGQEDTTETLGEDGFGMARRGGYWSRSGR